MASDYTPAPYPPSLISRAPGVGATQASALVASSAASNELQASPSAARLFSLSVLNTGSAQYVQIFDSLNAPANGAVPKMSFTLAATTGKDPINFEGGVPFRNGIYICNSSTAGTKTIGSANCLFAAAIG